MSNIWIFLFLIAPGHVDPKSLFKTPSIEDFRNRTSEDISEPIYAKIRDYPFVAKLYIRSREVEVQCGGTLVSPKWVLTAGHCVSLGEKAKVKRIDVCMGSSYLPSVTACNNRRTVKMIARPMSSADLAMLRLSEPFPITETIQPLDVTEYDLNNLTRSCVVMGWGWMHPGLTSPHLLQTRVKRLDYCFQGLVCVMARAHAPCKGDSGGPLVCGGTLVGVASIGENADCTRPSGVTAYVPVWQYNKFIAQSIANAASAPTDKSPTAAASICLLLITLSESLYALRVAFE